MKKYFLFSIVWILSIFFAILYSFENPELVEKIKTNFEKNKKPKIETQTSNILKTPGNSFILEFSNLLSTDKKTSFLYYDGDNLNFDKNNIYIYYQNGFFFKNGVLKKLNLPKNFTTKKNGGLKSVFIYKKNKFGLISSNNDDCFYASIIFLKTGKEIFKTKCLPDKNIDFNGLGSSHVHLNDKIILSVGTPEQSSSKIRELAQDKNSIFGKMIEINKNNLDEIIDGKKNMLAVNMFTLGHRNPQGLTKMNNLLFNVEHGPKGGDELNRIIANKNYGWPRVSYGTQYVYENGGKAYEINHEKNNFEEPLFALVPSVGISAVNTCPKVLKEYYQKPCLLALSLYGNSLRPGRSVIIYLLNEKRDKVHSIEKIQLRKDLKLRHFLTNEKNELYEDYDGNIYISADKKGIYKLSFTNFRD